MIPAAHPRVPSSIERLENQWLGWLGFLETCLALEHDALPSDVVGQLPKYPIGAADAVGTVFETTVQLAVGALGKNGRLVIDSQLYFQRFCGPSASTTLNRGSWVGRDIHDFTHIERARTFSPVAVYRAIAADYTDERVAELENEAIALEIYRAFSLNRYPVSIKAGCAVLTLNAYSEKKYASHGFSYCYNSERELESALDALVGVLETRLDRPGYLPDAKSSLQPMFGFASKGIASRTRLPITPDVTVVFYSQKFEVLLKADVAGRLNAFLGQWLNLDQECAEAQVSCAP